MKLLVKTDKPIKHLTSRDIRNFIASISSDNADEILWHKGGNLPRLVFTKPYDCAFEIISYSNNEDLINSIANNLQNKNIRIDKADANIISTIVGYEELIFEKLTKPITYVSRTPMILSANPVEYKIVYATNKYNKKDLFRYIIEKIKKDIQYKMKYYKKIDVSKEVENLQIDIKNAQLRLVEYKPYEKKKQAAYLTFESNYALPRFIGYKMGLGWGEIIQKVTE